MPTMYSFEATLDASNLTAVATGHVAPVMAWEDTPAGRRPGSSPEVDEVTHAPFQIADVLLPLGRDGKPELFGVRFASHEVPDLPPYSPVELIGLRVRIWPTKAAAKGIEVSFTADAVRPVGTQRGGRRSAGSEQTEAA